MRPQKRISVIKELLNTDENKEKILASLLGDDIKEIDISATVEDWNVQYDYLFKDWTDNPDMRIAQMLVTCNIIPNIPGFWYYKEDYKVLVDAGLAEARDILHWGQNYDKDMNRLPKTLWKPIKDLGTAHITAILGDIKAGKMKNIRPGYIEAFELELERR